MDYQSFQPGGQGQNQVPTSPPSVQVDFKKNFTPKFIGVIVLLLVLGTGAYTGIWYWGNQQVAQEIAPTFTPRANQTTYVNNQYGFSIALPESWKGYTVINNQWEATQLAYGNGPLITVRHPMWTAATPREDMPVMIFTPAQWSLIQQEKMTVSAAPIPPSVLGQNSKYVLALPARYNYDFKTGFEEVDQLVHTLKAFESTALGQFCGGIAGVACPSGYDCKLDGSYPDAGGTCVAVTKVGFGMLTGHVTIGPNCPVEQVGHPCTPAPEAYTSRQVIVSQADGTGPITTQNFDAQGNYSIPMPTGTYVVKSRTGISSTPSVVGTVTIKDGQTTTLNFSIDTGIR